MRKDLRDYFADFKECTLAFEELFKGVPKERRLLGIALKETKEFTKKIPLIRWLMSKRLLNGFKWKYFQRYVHNRDDMSYGLLNNFKIFVQSSSSTLGIKDRTRFTPRETALLYFMEGYRKRIHSAIHVMPFQGEWITYSRLHDAQVFDLTWDEVRQQEIEIRELEDDDHLLSTNPKGIVIGVHWVQIHTPSRFANEDM